MGERPPRQVHPDMKELLEDLTAAVMVAGGGSPPPPPPVRLVLGLTAGGRKRVPVLGCVCLLEELGNGKTKVYFTNGKNTTVDQDVDTVVTNLGAA